MESTIVVSYDGVWMTPGYVQTLSHPKRTIESWMGVGQIYDATTVSSYWCLLGNGGIKDP